MADTRFKEFWHQNGDVYVTVRARLTVSTSGWHDFVYAEPFADQNGFSIPDGLVVNIISAPPLPDPTWKVGDLVSAEFIDEHGEWAGSDYFEFISTSSHGGVWRSMRDVRQVLRQEMRRVTPIARDGRPWNDGDS